MVWLVSVLNLANTIIGVSVLSMPFVLQNCGVALGFLLIYGSSYLTIQSCLMLLKAAHITERPTYELLAQYLFGHPGKLLMEISNIGVLFGASIGMFVIIGDVAPTTIISLFSLDWDRYVLRQYTLIMMGVCVVLPMSLLRDIRKLSVAAGLSMIVYFTLVCYLIILSLPELLAFQWLHQIVYFDFTGVLRCVPILALAFCCQTTLFLVRESHSDKSTMGSVTKAAVTFCALLYASVGVFGYIVYYKHDIPGDILLAFFETKMAFVLKLLFALTVVASIPLCVFSSRNSLYSLITTYFIAPTKPVINGPAHIPTRHFFSITTVFVGLALLIALYIPNVELVLQLTGATMGSLIGFIFPGAYYLKATEKKASKRSLAMFMLCLGLFLMVVSTCVVVTQSRVEVPMQEVPTTHVTEVTTSETEKPVLNSEPTFVKKGNQDGDKPAVIEPGGDEKKEIVKDEHEDVAESEQDATEREKEKKGLMKEGSRQEPPVPLEVKEDPEEIEKQKPVPKVAQVHEKESHGEETGDLNSEHDSQGLVKKVVVDEVEQKRLMDRLNVLEQKVSKLSDEKKKEGESEADPKKTTDLQDHKRPVANGTHGVHSNKSSERIAPQQVVEDEQVQKGGGKEGGVKPTQPEDRVAVTQEEEPNQLGAESDTHGDALGNGPGGKENGVDVEVDDSPAGEEFKRDAPNEEDEKVGEGAEADNGAKERTKREVEIEEVNPDAHPSNATQDMSQIPPQGSKEGEGDEL